MTQPDAATIAQETSLESVKVRYNTDVEFHCRVKRASILVEQNYRDYHRGEPMDNDGIATSRYAIAVAIILSEYDQRMAEASP